MILFVDKYSSAFGSGMQQYAYFHDEDESSFQLVDTSRAQRPAYQRSRFKFNLVSVTISSNLPVIQPRMMQVSVIQLMSNLGSIFSDSSNVLPSNYLQVVLVSSKLYHLFMIFNFLEYYIRVVFF